MPKRELILQREIIQSVRKDGGWGRKLSHRTLVGLPDLALVLWPYVPVLAEVKDLGVRPNSRDFTVKLIVSEKQRHELLAYDAAINTPRESNSLIDIRKRHAAVLLVGWAWGGARWLAMLPPDATHLSSEEAPNVHRRPGGYYPFGSLAELFGRMHRIQLL